MSSLHTPLLPKSDNDQMMAANVRNGQRDDMSQGYNVGGYGRGGADDQFSMNTRGNKYTEQSYSNIDQRGPQYRFSKQMRGG